MRCFAKLFLLAKPLAAVALVFVLLSAPFTTTALALMSREPVVYRAAMPTDVEKYGSLIGPLAGTFDHVDVFEAGFPTLYRMCHQPEDDICLTGVIQSIGESYDLLVILNLPSQFDILVDPMKPCLECQLGMNITFEQAGETIHYIHVNENFVFVE